MHDAFSPDPERRFLATLDIGRRAYPSAASEWPGEDAFRDGCKAIAPLVPAERREAALAADVYSYGAWNPSVIFVGLSPGMGSTTLTREEEHVLGAPGFFRLYSFPQRLQGLTCVAFGHAVDASEERFGWLRPWVVDRPGDFLIAAGSAFSVLNLTSERRPAGDDPRIPPAVAAKRLERHLDAFHPVVVVAVKNKVTDLLRKAFPEANIPTPRPNATTPIIVENARLGDHRATFVGMPVHPDAYYPDQAARYAASEGPIAEAIGRGLLSRQ